MHKKKIQISILILAHNEEQTLKKEIEDIMRNMKKIPRYKYEIVVCEDGSKDNTKNILLKLKKKYNLKLSLKKKRIGYLRAFKNGVRLCLGKTIIFSDTGKKYNFKNLLIFLSHYHKTKVQLVAGFRVDRKDANIRKIMSFVYEKLINLIFFKNYRDYDCGFKIFDKKTLKLILFSNKFNKHLITSQIFIYFFLMKKKISQLPIKYLEEKNRSSRSFNFFNLPGVILSSVFNLFKIRFKMNYLP